MIRALPKAWEVKAATLKKLNDREEMNFSEFIGNLKTHEMEMKVRGEGREPNKKKSVAFKANLSIEDQEELSEEGEEDFTMLIQKVGRIFYKKGRQSNYRRGRSQGKFERRRRRWVLSFIARNGTSHSYIKTFHPKYLLMLG